MNNSSYDACQWYQTTGKVIAFFITYKVVTPIHFFLGVFGHVLCLIAFFQRGKKQKAYVYQIFVTISEGIEIVFYDLAVLISTGLSGRLGPGQAWYMSNYYLMYFAGHVILPIVNGLVTASTLFSVAMAADRVFALTKGAAYRNSNHKLRCWLVAIICLLVSFLTSGMDAIRFIVVPNGNGPGLYKLVSNTAFTGGRMAIAFAHLRASIRVASVLALTCCNVVLVHCYRKRMRKVANMTKASANEIRRKRDEKVLVYSTLLQACSTSLSTGALIHMHHLVFVQPAVWQCSGEFWGPFDDCITDLCSIADFYILVAVSQSFREIVVEGLRAVRKGIITQA